MKFSKFVGKKLIKKLVADVYNFRIFNEADLQYRIAYHIDRQYDKKYWLRNQPRISIGNKKGKRIVKPDIVVFNKKCGPVAAFELKNFINKKNPSSARSLNAVQKDIEKLKKFKRKYCDIKKVFAIILIRVDDKDEDKAIKKEFVRSRYLNVHVINICIKKVKKRKNYKEWLEDYKEWKKDFSHHCK